MRDVMLFLESCTDIEFDVDDGICFVETPLDDLCGALPKWGKADIFYSLFNLNQGGYIDASILDANNTVSECCVNYITLHGHEFLNSIRDDARWGKMKKGLSAIRDYSLSALSSIAKGMTEGAVTAWLTGAQG